MNSKSRFPGVGIIAPTPGSREGESGHTANRMMVDIFKNFHKKIHIFTRDTFKIRFSSPQVYVHKVHRPYYNCNFLKRMIGQAAYQIRIAVKICSVRHDLSLIYFGGQGLILPLIISKSLGIKTIHRHGGGRLEDQTIISSSFSLVKIWGKFLHLITHFTYHLFDRIIVITPNMINFSGLKRYNNKIHIWNHFFYDMNLFRPIVKIQEREDVIGYVGVISKLKGVPHLISSIIKIAKTDKHFKFLIVGDGPYFTEAKEEIEKYELNENVIFTGWVSPEKIPVYMNKIKLLVIPSEIEGLPKVLLEAMACGTPVLASSVGGVPDILDHDVNGFIFKRDQIGDLHNLIFRALDMDLTSISQNARNFVKQRYAYSSAVLGYKRLLIEFKHSFKMP